MSRPRPEDGDDERVWQGLARHLARVERLLPTTPAWRPRASSSAALQPHGRGGETIGLAIVGGAGAVAVTIVLVATLVLGPLGTRRSGNPTPMTGPWASLGLEAVPTIGVFEPGDNVDSMLAWRGGFVAAGLRYPASGPPTGGTTLAWWSSDGRAWHRATVDQGDGADIRLIVSLGDRLLALGGPLFLPSCPVRCWTSPPSWFWTSSDGRTWHRLATDSTFENPVASFDRAAISDLTAGPAGLVAVGGTGIDSPAIWTSSDGATWHGVDLATVMPHGTLEGVAWAHGRYVAVGSVPDQAIERPLDMVGAARHSVVLTSNDGRSWRSTTVRPDPARPLDRVFVGATGAVIAATGCPTCATSSPFYAVDEGGAWRPIPASGPTDADLVASDGQRIVSVRPEAGSVGAWQTAGSDAWHVLPVSGTFGPEVAPRLALGAMAIGPTSVAIAGRTLVGNQWQPRMWLAMARGPASPPSATPSASAAATIPSSTSPTSWGTIAWHRAELPGDGPGTTVAAISGWRGGFGAGGAANGPHGTEAALWSSLDGTIWSRIAQGTPGFAGAQILQILGTSAGLLARGGTPGPTPSCAPPGKGYPYAPYPLCGVARPTLLWRSSDGRTWTRIQPLDTLEGGTITALAAGRGRLVAVGYGADPSTGRVGAALWTSTDGSTWQRQGDAAFADAEISGIVATAEGFVAYGTSWPAGATFGDPHVSAAIWSSPDGISWAPASLPPVGAGIAAVYAAAEGMVGVAMPCSPISSCAGAEANLWSADGRTWAPLPGGTIHEPLGDRGGVGAILGSDGQRIVAVGGPTPDLAQVTADGRHWQDVPGANGPNPPLLDGVLGVGSSGLALSFTGLAGGSPSLWFGRAGP